MVAYVLDDNLRDETNRNGRNYWDAYLQEICGLLGLSASPLSLQELEDGEILEQVNALIVGHVSGDHLTDQMIENLEGWVRKGGILVGFGIKGLDHVFGIETVSEIEQEPDDYAISGYFHLRPHAITHEVHPSLFMEQKLLIFSDIQAVNAEGSLELARLYDTEHNDLQHPAITGNRYGEGFAGYFAFDVAKTVWLLHQGGPLPDCREKDQDRPITILSIVGENTRMVRYADEIVFIIQNMIAQYPQPFIYQIPPMGGKIPDALLYWGGDEYRGPVERSLKASDWMREKGLAYHVNIEIDNHPMSAEEWQQIRDNGHEVSNYFVFGGKQHNEQSLRKEIKRQSDLFLRKFGVRLVCTFYKSFAYHPRTILPGDDQWDDWTGPVRWLAEAGIKADNSYCGRNISNSWFHNGPSVDFGFGTGYPFYFYADYQHGNRPIDFLEEPINCYEMGHRGSILSENGEASPLNKEMRTWEEVHLPIDMAIKYHLVMNMFYHPIYIVENQPCREAIEEILRYIEERKATVKHMGNDQVWEWWDARSRSRVEEVNIQGDSIKFRCDCKYPAGMIVKVAVSNREISKVISGGETLPHQTREEFGNTWLYLVVPAGEQEIEVQFADNQ